MIPFFIDFSRFWRPLGPQVGPMLKTCWPENPPKSGFDSNNKKTLKKQTPGRIERIFSGILGSLKLTENILVKAVQEQKTRPRS